MKPAKCFDIYDEDITPEIYALLFCGAFIELHGNDIWYRIFPFGDAEYGDEGEWETYDNGMQVINDRKYHYSSEYHFSEYLKRHGKSNDLLKKLVENPCTCEYAIKHFKEWLTERGVTKNDILFVKLWW